MKVLRLQNLYRLCQLELRSNFKVVSSQCIRKTKASQHDFSVITEAITAGVWFFYTETSLIMHPVILKQFVFILPSVEGRSHANKLLHL